MAADFRFSAIAMALALGMGRAAAAEAPEPAPAHCDDHSARIAAIIAAADKSPPPPPVLTPTDVTVNRTVPTSEALPTVLDAQPTAAEIARLSPFPEPLIPVGGKPTPAEDRDLSAALRAYSAQPDRHQVQALVGFLDTHPESSWRASLLVNLGVIYRQTGFFSKSFACWEEAWTLAKAETRPAQRALADRAIAELAQINAWVGRADELEAIFAEIKDRHPEGTAAEKLSQARYGLSSMRTNPAVSFKCGPYAVDRIRMLLPGAGDTPALVRDYPCTTHGTSLLQVRDLAKAIGLDYQAAHRQPGAAMPVPAVVHWKVGHYSAILREAHGLYLVQDSTMDGHYGHQLWLTREAIDAEASGAMLVRGGPLPEGWKSLDDAESGAVWGRGLTNGVDPSLTSPCDEKAGGCQSGACQGMPAYAFHIAVVSLNIVDTPVGYSPPKGPGVGFTATYSQREAMQPANFTYWNLGQRWTSSWLSYANETVYYSNSVPVEAVYVFYLPGGGFETLGIDLTQRGNEISVPFYRTHDFAVYTSNSVQLQRADGSTFSYGTRAAGNSSQIFMTSLSDPQGNAVNLTYDGQNRLTAISDALGQVTSLAYGDTDPLKVTRVTDPFGRYAQFAYTGGRLSGITDVIGMSSTFAHGDGTDAITAMTTPYGTTSFVTTDVGTGGYNEQRIIEATDPQGDVEHIEWCTTPPGVAQQDPPSTVPSGFPLMYNDYLNYRNTYYWDKKAMNLARGDYTKAVSYHFMHDGGMRSGVLQSIKLPLENRTWYLYPGQTSAIDIAGITANTPSISARVLEDGSTQAVTTVVNSMNRPIMTTDPLGRQTRYVYMPNGIDLREIHQMSGGSDALLSTTTYNLRSLSRPHTITDSAGKTTTCTWNTAGQLTSLQNARNETTNYYYLANGYLDKIVDATLAETHFTYDGFGRLRTITNSDTYTIVYDYDALDRIVQITYPDGTTSRLVWNRLDLERTCDRLGRWTRTYYNSMRQPIGVVDPSGCLLTMDWCLCGSISRMVDSNGHSTLWDYDLEGHLVQKTLPDGGATRLEYSSSSGRKLRITDANGQTTSLSYNRDDTIRQMSFSNSLVPTASVSYTYDAVFPRISSLTDATGTTQYSYYPIGASPTLGAGQIKDIDGPLANDTITYTYDELGRLASRSINGVNENLSLDNLGRLQRQSNALGNFDYTYEGSTNRVSSLRYPNGLLTSFNYQSIANDKHLQSIRNVNSTGVNISTLNYTYDAIGRIQSWSRQNDAQAVSTFTYNYDSADRLLSAIQRNSDGTVTSNLGYSYDPAGNRTSIQTLTSLVTSNFNSGNRLQSSSSGGKLALAGHLNEAGTVTINGVATPLAADNTFTGSTPVIPGNSTFDVQAKDAAGNIRSKTYQFNTAANGAWVFQYDGNGNLLNDGTRTLTWDACNRLVAVVIGNQRSDFSYDGLNRRVRITESLGGIVTSDHRYIWDGPALVEERDSTGSIVTKRFFSNGVQINGQNYYYTCDHQGSVRDITDTTCTLITRYDYDPYGTQIKTFGSMDFDIGYSMTLIHRPSGLNLTWFRAFNSQMGRWLSRDPMGEGGGINLYAYCRGDPIGLVDPFGLSWYNPVDWFVNPTSANFFAGVGDALTFGLTNKVRDMIGGNGVVDKCSGAYRAGWWSGAAYGVVLSPGFTVMTAPGKAMFWSGIGAEAAVLNAEARGLTALEMTLGGKYIAPALSDAAGWIGAKIGLSSQGAWEMLQRPIWSVFSAYYALGASGRVTVVGTYGGWVWRNVESVILRFTHMRF